MRIAAQLANLLLREAHNVNKMKKTPRDENFGKKPYLLLKELFGKE